MRSNEPLFHLLRLNYEQQAVLKYVLDYHSWCLMHVLTKLLPYTSQKKKSTLILTYYARMYSAIKVAASLTDFSNKSEEKVFRIDRHTFEEVHKSFANFDLYNYDSNPVPENEIDRISNVYPGLKENVDMASLFCYTFDEIKGMR